MKDVKKRKKFVIAGAVLAAVILFCLWYSWPRSWASLTTEEETRFSAWLDMADPDWDAETTGQPISYLCWELTEEDAEGEAAQAIRAALNQYTYRRSFSSLIPRNTYSMKGRPDSIDISVMWNGDSSLFTFYSDGTAITSSSLGFDVYRYDPALFETLAGLVQKYGVQGE